MGRWAAWTVSLGLAASGVASFVLNGPLEVSIALEVGGWGLGAWLHRARRARLAAVRAWEADRA